MNVQNRIAALKNLQDKHAVFDDQFEMEVIALEKKYHALHFSGIYEQSNKIINGQYEPTEEECERKPSEDDAPEGAIITEIDDSVVGVPEFWLTALKNTRYFQENITEADEPALRYLKDISLEYLADNPV
jgi:nucleosome assembly protein 1-like 1